MPSKTSRWRTVLAGAVTGCLILAFPWGIAQTTSDVEERVRKLEQDNAVLRQYTSDLQMAKLRDRTTALESTMEMSKWLLVSLNAIAAGMGLYLFSSMRRVHLALREGQAVRKELKVIQEQIGALPCMRDTIPIITE